MFQIFVDIFFCSFTFHGTFYLNFKPIIFFILIDKKENTFFRVTLQLTFVKSSLYTQEGELRGADV